MRGPETDPDALGGEGRSPRSRTVLVTFLGAVVRRLGGWMPIGGTVELMTQLGLDAQSARTAVFRLKKRGWLEPESRQGVRGYVLTPVALAALATGDEVIWHAREAPQLHDGWCIVNFSVPESERSRRHQLRAQLTSLGFGNVGTAMWIAPARMCAAAERAIAELGLTSYAAVFVGDHVGGQDLSTLLARAWDLQALDARYREFVARFGPGDATEREGNDPAAAFVTYVSLVDHWRKLPFSDPGLPRQLLPADWPAAEAVALFEHLVELLQDRALTHAARQWPGARAPNPPIGRSQWSSAIT